MLFTRSGRLRVGSGWREALAAVSAKVAATAAAVTSC